MDKRDQKILPTFSPYQEQFMLEYFKEMRREINLRIGNHSSLVWAKILTTGAVMGFLITQNVSPDVKTYGFILVPIVAILYDVMIAQNIKAIHSIGIFIRDNIENILFPNFTLWEKYGGQHDPNRRNYGGVDIFLLSLFTFGTMVASFYMLWTGGYTQLAIVYGIVLIAAFIGVVTFMTRYILYFKK